MAKKRGRRVSARKKTKKKKRSKSRTKGLGRGLVELTGLRGSRLGVPGNERRKPGRTLPGGAGTSLFGKKKKKKRKSKKRKGRKGRKGVRSLRRKGAKRKSMGRKRKGRKKSKKLGRRPRMLYGLNGDAAAVARGGSLPVAMAKGRKKDTPVIGAYKYLYGSKAGWASMSGAVLGYQIAEIAAAGIVSLGASLFNKAGAAPVVTPHGFIPNVLSDFITAGLLWELGNQFEMENFGAFAAVVAATRSLNHVAASQVTAPAMGMLGLKPASVALGTQFSLTGMGAWHEYGYEGGGVGLYRESDRMPLSLYREAEDAPLGLVRVPDGAMIGLDGVDGDFAAVGDDGTLFG